MNKKNILTAAVSLSLVACLSIGATLAYFTDKTETAQNVFTTGKVDITLTDTSNGPDEDDTWVAITRGDGVIYQNVMPGDTLSKIVGVTPTHDSSDSYVAMRVVVSGPEEETGNGKWVEMAEQVAAAAGENGWYTSVSLTQTGAVVDCYYSELVTKDQYVSLFDEVNIPAVWGNDVASATFTMDVSAAAIQAANLEAPACDEMGIFNDTVLELKALLNEG